MRKVAVTVLLDDNLNGIAARLWLERIDDGNNGIGTIYPDPNIMAFVRYDAAFARAIQDAWDWVERPERADVRWWLEPLTPATTLLSLSGLSFGVPFALGLRHLFDEALAPLDSSIAITGAIALGDNRQLRIAGVDGYRAKLAAAAAHNTIHTVLVPAEDLDRARQQASAGLKVEPYTDLTAASDRASGLVHDLITYCDGLIAWLENPPSYYPLEIQQRFDFTALDQSVRVSQKRLPWRQGMEARTREAERRAGDTDDESWLRRIYSQRSDELYRKALKEAVVRSWQEVRETPLAVLLGDPGYGKSWRLKAEAIAEARAQQEKLLAGNVSLDDSVLPVFVRLPELAAVLESEPRLYGALVETVKKPPVHFDALPPRFWKWMLKRLEESLAPTPKRTQLGCLLLLDGLDEVHQNQTLLQDQFKTIDDHSARRILLASRVVGYDEGGGWPFAPSANKGQREFEMLTLALDQAARFVAEWFREDPARGQLVQRQIDQGGHAVRGLARIPLMLSFICLIGITSDEPIPTRRVDLYEAMLYALLRSSWRDGQQGETRLSSDMAKLDVLAEVAWRFATGERGWTDILPIRDLDKAITNAKAVTRVPRKASETILGGFLEGGIFVAAGAAPAMQAHRVPYLWAHRSLAEYLVARYLADQPESVWSDTVERHRWFDPDWVEPISLLGGKLDDPNQLIALLLDEPELDVFHEQLLLASRVASEACPGTIPDKQVESIVTTLLRILARSRSESEREDSTRVLMLLGNVALPFLIKAMYEADRTVHQACYDVLGNIGDAVAIPVLIDGLRDPDTEVRWRAADALGKIGDPVAIPVLIDSLRDPDAEVQWRSAGALSKIGNPATAALIDGLRDPDAEVRRLAADALGKIGDPAAAFALIDSLRDLDAGVRRLAADSLGEIGGPSAIPTLIEYLQDPDVGVRRRVAGVLGELGDPAAILALIDSLRDPDAETRRLVANALGKIGGPAAIPSLIGDLRDPDVGVRWRAADALGEIGDPATIPALLDCLRDPNVGVRRLVVETLGKIGGPAVVPMLVDSVRDPDAGVRRRIVDAFGEIGDPTVIPTLIDSLRDPDAGVRQRAADVFGEISDPAVIPTLIDSLRDPAAAVRRLAAGALGQIDDPTCVSALIGSLRDSDAGVRWQVANMLAKIGNPAAIPTLIGGLQNVHAGIRQEAVDALSKIGDPAIPFLTDSLQDPDAEVRWLAANALARIGDPATVPTVIEILLGTDHGDRRRVISTIAAYGEKLANSAQYSGLRRIADALLSANYADKGELTDAVQLRCYDYLKSLVPNLKRLCQTDFEWREWRVKLMPLIEQMLH